MTEITSAKSLALCYCHNRSSKDILSFFPLPLWAGPLSLPIFSLLKKEMKCLRTKLPRLTEKHVHGEKGWKKQWALGPKFHLMKMDFLLEISSAWTSQSWPGEIFPTFLSPSWCLRSEVNRVWVDHAAVARKG